MKKNNKVCCIYNYAQHYRQGIFALMDQELDCDFYFGDKYLDIKKMDYSVLHNFKKELKNIHIIGPLYWQKGVVSLAFAPYSHYIILGDYFCLSTWILLILTKLSPKKTLVWTHGWYGDENYVKKTLKRIFFFFSNCFLLYGDYARDLMIKAQFDGKKLFCIYNSLDYDNQLKIRSSLVLSDIYTERFNNSNKNIVFIGRLTNVKKIDLLIKSLSDLAQNGIYLNLTIIGNGEEYNALKKLAFDLGFVNIWFFGSCYDEQTIAEFLYNADICVAPGNVGLTAIHSLTYGTPVITHNCYCRQMPEFEVIKDGFTGAFFEYENCSSLGKSISDWIIFSKGKREEIRRNCYGIIDSKYNPSFQISVLKKLI